MTENFSYQALEFDKIKSHLKRHALTALGVERVDALHPIVDAALLSKILEATVEMADLVRYDDAFPIHTLQDIRQDLANIRAAGTFLKPDRLLHVLATLQTSRRIQSYIENRSTKYPVLQKLTSTLHTFRDIEAEIEKAIDETGEIKDTASPALRHVRRELDSKGQLVRKRLEALARQFTAKGFATDAIVTLRGGRMVIPVKDEYKNAVQGFIHDESASGQTVFIEPAEVLELNNAIRKLQLDETREIERILIAIADAIRLELSFIDQDLDTLGEVELLYVKAHFARSLNAVRPHSTSDFVIQLKDARHPLLLLKEDRKPSDRRNVVPLNLQLGIDGGTLIISGPNAGGKTVALKTVGLLCLMYQSGLLVPCEHGSALPVFSQILADIGDLQSIENDLSTFSSHVQMLGQMAERVNPSTLLLIDEIGSGTDPKEGSALAIALLKHFNHCHALAIVTTHHGELKIFAHDTEGVLNGSMEFDPVSLEPTYVFRPGVPGSSYAFEISQRMGLASSILDEAKQLLGSETMQQEKLILDLHRKMREYEGRIAEIDRKRADLDDLSKAYEERSRSLKTAERMLKTRMNEEKQKWFHDQKSKIDSIIRELRNAASDKTWQVAKTELRSIESRLNEETKSLRSSDRILETLNEVRIGQRVYVKSMEVEGVVSEIYPGDRVGISVGQLSMKIDKHLLAAIPDRLTPKPTSSGSVQWDTEGIRDEIDLRGYTTDEALIEVDRYLSDAQVLGYRKITIVHGKGDGILRKKIGEYLKKDLRVAAFRLGQWGEGDSGVTVVELK